MHDGDTVWPLDDDNVRLLGMDAPEIGRPFVKKSSDRLGKLIEGRTVEIEFHGHDRHRRPLARLEIEGQDVNRRIVFDGLAWHFKWYSNDTTLAAAQADVRAAGRGPWGDVEPMPLWEWRTSEAERNAARRQLAAKILRRLQGGWLQNLLKSRVRGHDDFGVIHDRDRVYAQSSAVATQ